MSSLPLYPQNPWGCTSRLCLLSGVFVTSAVMLVLLMTTGSPLRFSAPLKGDLVDDGQGNCVVSGTYTAVGDITCTNLTVDAGATLELGSYNLSVSNTFSNNGTIVASGAQYILPGDSDSGTYRLGPVGMSNNHTFYNLEVTGNLNTSDNNLTVNGNLTINADSSVRVSYANTVTVAGTLTNNGMIQITGLACPVLTLNGSIASMGTIDLKTGVLQIPCDLPAYNFDNLILSAYYSSGDSFVLTGMTSVSGTLSIGQSLMLTTGMQTLSLGSAIVVAHPTMVLNGSLDVSSQTVQYSGDAVAPQSLPLGNTYGNIVFQGSQTTYFLNQGLTVSGTITVDSQTTLDPYGYTVNSATIINNGTIDLSREGSLLTAAVTNNGTITCPVSKAWNGTICASCGNAQIDDMEECDDGDVTDLDGCSALCTVETGFQCASSPSICTPICGDGLVLGAEGCDDGGTAAGDGCSATCDVEIGFACDSAEPTVCTSLCGNSTLNDSESCDDGNTVNADGCSSACTVESGYSCSNAGAGSCVQVGGGAKGAVSNLVRSLQTLWDSVSTTAPGGGEPSPGNATHDSAPVPNIDTAVPPSSVPAGNEASVESPAVNASSLRSTVKAEELLSLVTSGITPHGSIASKVDLSSDRIVTRIEAVQVILEQLNITPDRRISKIENPVRRALVTAQRLGILRGDAKSGRFYPDRAVTKTELNIMIERAKNAALK